jgi:hypothetical protein
MVSARWISAGLLAMAAVAGAALWLQRQAAADLRDEIALLRGDQREIARLRTENQRLAEALPPEEKMQELRADRAAVVRLRGEIERTRGNLEARERALETPPVAAPAAPTLKLAVGVSLAGQLTSSGQPFDPAALRQQLAALPRGSTFEIVVQLPKAENGVPFDEVGKGVEAVARRAKEIAQELGLKLSLRMEPARK